MDKWPPLERIDIARSERREIPGEPPPTPPWRGRNDRYKRPPSQEGKPARKPTMDHRKIADFLMNRLEETTLATDDRQVLQGWHESTLVSFNAAVKKFKQFKKSTGEKTF
jgi:hypothetical protein